MFTNISPHPFITWKNLDMNEQLLFSRGSTTATPTDLSKLASNTGLVEQLSCWSAMSKLKKRSMKIPPEKRSMNCFRWGCTVDMAWDAHWGPAAAGYGQLHHQALDTELPNKWNNVHSIGFVSEQETLAESWHILAFFKGKGLSRNFLPYLKQWGKDCKTAKWIAGCKRVVDGSFEKTWKQWTTSKQSLWTRYFQLLNCQERESWDVCRKK